MAFLSTILRRFCAITAGGVLVLAGMSAIAQQPPPQTAAQPLGQARLEQLLAPIALYPDGLVAQILIASTYPLDVVQAARWASEHPNVQGDALQDAMQQQPWDASVKSLTAVPQVLAMMSDKLDWMQQVGEAFLAQPNDVSHALQQLRAKAAANGYLKSSNQLKVSAIAAPTTQPPESPPGVDPALLPPPAPLDYVMMIEPANPDMLSVPIYDPSVVYNSWPWPEYMPFYWYPPGYVLGAAVVGFGGGYLVGPALWAHYNWAGGRVNIDVGRYNRFNRTNLAAAGGFSNWQFNAAHRGTVGFGNAALRQQFGGGAAQVNANINKNVNTNRDLIVNENVNSERDVNINKEVNINRNANLDRNANVNRTLNVNRTVNTNRGVNAAVNRVVSPPSVGAHKRQ